MLMHDDESSSVPVMSHHGDESSSVLVMSHPVC